MKKWSVSIDENQIDVWGGVKANIVSGENPKIITVMDRNRELGRIMINKNGENEFISNEEEMILEPCVHCICDDVEEITIRNRRTTDHPASFCARCLHEGCDQILKEWKQEVVMNIRDLRKGQELSISSPYLVYGLEIPDGWPNGAIVKKEGRRYKLEICRCSTNPIRYTYAMKQSDIIDTIFESIL